MVPLVVGVHLMRKGSPAMMVLVPSGLVMGFSVLEAAKTTDAKAVKRAAVENCILAVYCIGRLLTMSKE